MTSQKICGIYKITNILNNKCYIGQSIDCIYRLIKHKSKLNVNKHYNLYLQRAYNKYGKDNFTFEIIFLCNIQDLDGHEQHFINHLKTLDNKFGYNSQSGGSFTKQYSDESRLKMSNSHKGHIPWNKGIKGMIKLKKSSMKGKKHTIEARLKISEAGRGRAVSTETRKKISDTLKQRKYTK